MLASGVILVCGPRGHSSTVHHGGAGVVIAYLCPEHLTAWVCWLKKSDNKLHWSRSDDLAGVVERLCEQVVLFVKEAKTMILLGDALGARDAVISDLTDRVRELETVEVQLKEQLGIKDKQLNPLGHEVETLSKHVLDLELQGSIDTAANQTVFDKAQSDVAASFAREQQCATAGEKKDAEVLQLRSNIVVLEEAALLNKPVTDMDQTLEIKDKQLPKTQLLVDNRQA
jgi:hypothetical protein